jgi:hypothetical protein
MRYHSDFVDCDKDVYISGFWQCERYFQRFEDEIRRDFVIRKEHLENTDRWLQLIQSGTSISLHVRRGDYVANPATNAFHGLCEPEYYQKALKKMTENTENPVVYIFSDDIQWCKQNLKPELSHHYVETGSAYKDLFLMRSCKHNIIANSSFSWWGAWLNINSQKIVIAPSVWFKDPSAQYNDIIPINWYKI